ncbi:MAG: hypothetical protein ACJ71M_17040, partial [Nitrososphaeraceae archaeon]
KKKSDYMINIDRSKMLDLRFFENLVWVALHKAWKGYVIAKNKDEYDKNAALCRNHPRAAG